MSEKLRVTSEQVGIFMSVIMIVFLLLRGVAMLMHQPYLGYLSQLLLAVAFFSVTCSCAAERREHHKATSFMAIGFAVAALLQTYDTVRYLTGVFLRDGTEFPFIRTEEVELFGFFGAALLCTGIMAHPHSKIGSVRKILMIASALPAVLIFSIGLTPLCRMDTGLMKTILFWCFLLILLAVSVLNTIHFVKTEKAMHGDRKESERPQVSGVRLREAKKMLRNIKNDRNV